MAHFGTINHHNPIGWAGSGPFTPTNSALHTWATHLQILIWIKRCCRLNVRVKQLLYKVLHMGIRCFIIVLQWSIKRHNNPLHFKISQILISFSYFYAILNPLQPKILDQLDCRDPVFFVKVT